jgi:hypothetical protein
VATEVVALPTGEGLILGLPWYIWGFVAMGFVMMILVMIFIFYWYSMGPVRDYFGAQYKGVDVALFLRKSGRMSIKSVKYVTGVFNAIGLPLSWIQRSDDSFRLGKCSAKVVCDTTGIATEPTINQAIKTWVAEWNDKEFRKQDKYAENGMSYTPQLVMDYYDLYKMIKDGFIDDPIVMPAIFEVPLWEVERYLAHVGPGDLEGHIAQRVAEAMQKADDKTIPQWMWMAIIVIGLMLGAFTIMNYFGAGK